MHIMQLFSENIWSNNFAKNEENQFAEEDFHKSFVVTVFTVPKEGNVEMH